MLIFNVNNSLIRKKTFINFKATHRNQNDKQFVTFNVFVFYISFQTTIIIFISITHEI